MKQHDIQFIEKNGHREWAIIPYDTYQHLLSSRTITDEDLEDIAAYDQAVIADDGYRIPAAVTFDIVGGLHPIAAWRKHQSISQVALAEKAGISKAYLSQIESGKREGKLGVLKDLSKALAVPLDVLVK